MSEDRTCSVRASGGYGGASGKAPDFIVSEDRTCSVRVNRGYGGASGKAPDIMRHHLTFWKAMFKKPLTTGAVVPSSKKLCNKMLEQTRLEEADCVVELGPGTGVLTKRIAPRLKKNALLLCIDCNADMVKYLKKQVAGARIIHDNAEHLKTYLSEVDTQADLIFSGIPFANLPKGKTEKILEVVRSSLKPDGKFVMFQYMHSAVHPRGKGILKILREKFKNVKSKRVFGNIPPAFVFICS